MAANLFSACGNSAQKSSEALLLGKWELIEALRNGRPTESLDELYFEFYEDGQMNTNLTGEPQVGVYKLNEGVIEQRESVINADYAVEELNDSLLVISTSLQNYSFRFRLIRAIQEE